MERKTDNQATLNSFGQARSERLDLEGSPFKFDMDKGVTLTSRIGKRVYDFPYKTRDVANYLWVLSKEWVESRGRSFLSTEPFKRELYIVAEYLCTETKKFGLFINGNPGNGKTTIAHATKDFFNLLVDNGKIDWGESYEGKNRMLFINARDLSDIFCSDRDRFSLIKRSPAIILDDVGEDKRDVVLYGNIFSPLIEIIEYRYDHLLPTIIVSNLTAEMFDEKYHSDRVHDRMIEMFKVISFDGGSFR